MKTYIQFTATYVALKRFLALLLHNQMDKVTYFLLPPHLSLWKYNEEVASEHCLRKILFVLAANSEERKLS